MNPLGDRRRAEELARLLEGAVTGPGARTAGYAALAARLRQVAPALDDAFAPRAEFRALLRRRLLAVAAVQDAVPAPEPAHGLQAAVAWSRTWKAQRRIAAAAGVMAAVVGCALAAGVFGSHAALGRLQVEPRQLAARAASERSDLDAVARRPVRFGERLNPDVGLTQRRAA